jgi:two-component system CheB/CheR fusion protein
MGLPVDQLAEPLRQVRESPAEQRELTIEATNRRGRAIQCQVTLNCLHRPGDDRHRGVVLLMEAEPLVEEA